jgi:hypothetical protein
MTPTSFSFFGLNITGEMWFFIDILPVFVAMYALFIMFIQISERNDFLSNTHKIAIYMSMVGAVLLILAQGGWSTAYLNGVPFVSSLMDNVWTIFNMLTCVIYIQITKIRSV